MIDFGWFENKALVKLCLPVVVALVGGLLCAGATGQAQSGSSSTDTEAAFREAQQRLEGLTDYRLNRAVGLQSQGTEEFESYLREQLSAIGADTLESIETRLRRVGLLSRDTDLQGSLRELYGQQAGAYYDPRTHTIYRLARNLTAPARKFLYSHELVHAYQQERYDLVELRRQAFKRGTLDAQITLAFLTEGHANLLAYLDFMNLSDTGSDTLQRPNLGLSVKLMARFSRLSPDEVQGMGGPLGGEGFDLKPSQGVPITLYRVLTDPYFTGTRLWLERARELGWGEAERWLGSKRPRSTRELFLGKHDGEQGIRSPSGRPLGFYLLMRWLDQFPDFPDWARGYRDDVLRVSGDDQPAVWQIKFAQSKLAEDFLDRVRDFRDGDQLTVPLTGRTRTVTTSRAGETVTIRFQPVSSGGR